MLTGAAEGLTVWFQQAIQLFKQKKKKQKIGKAYVYEVWQFYFEKVIV